MAFSLSNWFKGKPGAPGEESDESQTAPKETAAPAAAPTAPPPPSVRTVTPTAQKAPVSLRSPGRPTVTVPTAKLPVSSKVTPALPTSRKVAFPTAATPAPAPASMPTPRPASAPEPAPAAPDITIALTIGDFLDRLPPSFLQPGSFDRQKTVEFQASELYSDLLKGRASVPASVIYQRCPEIFSRPVTETEDVEVQLPLQKLVEQMGMALSTRQDQVEEENVGEIETPFLQVAMEDNARLPTAKGSAAGAVRPSQALAPPPFRPLGTPSADANGEHVAPTRPHRTGTISTIKPPPEQVPPLAPPTAATSGPIIPGKRPPSTVRASVAGGKIRLSGPAAVNRISAVPGQDATQAPSTNSQRINLPVQPTSPSHQVSKKTARIQIPPISLRAGGPSAPPRTGPTPPMADALPPAPGAEPLTNLRPSVGKDSSMPPISFRTSPPPPSSARPMPPSFAPPRTTPSFPPPAFPSAPPVARVPAPVAPATADDRKIELGLAAILRSLPMSMLAVEPSSVPDDVRITLPFALIEPQLSQGRVSVKREVFLQALPEAHRQVFEGDEPADIPLPLQEVFQHLPTNALSMRADQVTEETGTHYPTPFSQKADEDAQRFSPPAPVPAPENKLETPAPEEVAEATADTVTDVPLDQTEPVTTPAEPVEAQPVAEEPVRDVPLDESPAPAESTTEPVRDVPLDEAETPAASSVEPPVEAETETQRDIPLDLEPSAPVEPAVETVTDDATPAPVEEISAPAAETSLPMPEVEEPAPSIAAEEPSAEPVAAKVEEVEPVKEAPVAATVRADDSVLQTLFMTEEDMDAKTVVKLVCQLPGVNGCAVMFEDGLRLAGNFPDGDTEGFCAMSAPFYKRAVRFVSELSLGHLQTFTLHTENGLLSFFMHDNICMSVRHTGRGFLPGVREKLETVTRELARMYATLKPAQHNE